MNDYKHVWGWGELSIHHLWMELKYDPDDNGYHASVWDADGVTGIADSYTALEAIAVAHHRQQANKERINREESE